MRNFLTADIGTTSVKTCLIDERFHIIRKHSTEYILKTGENTAELDPEIYWTAVRDGIVSVISGGWHKDISGIAVTTQGETLIPVNAEGKPLHPAVVWLDARAEAQAEQIMSVTNDRLFYKTTGIPEINGLCPISKLLWFKQERPQIYNDAAYFLLLEDFILHRLTGRFITEKSLLSTTGYFDVANDCIWHEILDAIGLDGSKIPSAAECGEVIGTVLPEVARELGLPPGVPVVTGAMDQVAGAIGAGNFRPGIITETTGTALCIGSTVTSAEINTAFNIPVYRHYRRGLALLIPVCMTAGMALKWFKDVFCSQEQDAAANQNVSVYELLDRLAKNSPPLSNGIVMLPYFSGSLQPNNVPDFRAGFSGIGLNCTKPDFIRAILEGVGYMLKENLLLLERAGGARTERIISMGGGAASDLWCGIKANIADTEIVTLEENETASLGAAMLCAVGRGIYPSIEAAFAKADRTEKVNRPEPELVEKYKTGFQKYSGVLDAMLKGYVNEKTN